MLDENDEKEYSPIYNTFVLGTIVHSPLRSCHFNILLQTARPTTSLKMNLLQDPVEEVSTFLQNEAGVKTVPGDLSALVRNT